jgi:hypothetical protein
VGSPNKAVHCCALSRVKHGACSAPRSGVEALLPTQFGAKGSGKARVAVARKLGSRLWIMLRDEINYPEFNVISTDSPQWFTLSTLQIGRHWPVSGDLFQVDDKVHVNE